MKKSMLLWLSFVIIFIGVLALFPRLFSTHEMLFQIVAVVLSVLFTAIVTNQLLSGQSSNEESRERNIKVYENKIAVYSDFISKMWATVDDGKILPEEIQAIRSEIFNRLIFYLSTEQIDRISAEFGGLNSDDSDQKYIKAFERITNILREDVIGDDRDKRKKRAGETAPEQGGGDKSAILTLWDRFNKLLPQRKEDDDPVSDPADEAPSSVPAVTSMRGNTFVHFCVWGRDFQFGLFESGANALVLCEYGDVKRTNRLKSVKPDELVFLYQSGGPGYIGVFRARGWVVFESAGDGVLSREEKILYDSQSSPSVVESEAERRADGEIYQIDWFLNDGCKLISYLLVEPLAFYEKGVGRISVYRPTISTYHPTYAGMTLARFLAVSRSDADAMGKYHLGGKELQLACNTAAFTEIVNGYAIQPAEKNTDGSWK